MKTKGEIKLTNHETVEIKVSKKRRAPMKVQKTGAEIVAEIENLQHQVDEFAKALEEVDPSSVAYPVVKAAYDDKADELKIALNQIHHS